MNEIIIHPRAEKGLRGLPSTERRNVLSIITRLRDNEWKDILHDRNLHQLRMKEGMKLYSYRASPRIRLIIRLLENKKIIIEDVASYDTLQRYFNWGEE